MAELLFLIFLSCENQSLHSAEGHAARRRTGYARCKVTVKQKLFYRSIDNAVDNLLLTYNIENQNRQQCQQIRCKRQVIVGSEL